MNVEVADHPSSRDTLIEKAWATLSPQQKSHCTVNVLRTEISWQWQRARNLIIAGWAAQTLAIVPAVALCARLTLVLDLVSDELGDSWEVPDADDAAETTAWGLACLRWVHLERVNKEPLPSPHFNDEELHLYIAAQQLPLLGASVLQMMEQTK